MSNTDKSEAKKILCEGCRSRQKCNQVGKPIFHKVMIDGTIKTSVRPLSHPEYFNGPYH